MKNAFLAIFAASMAAFSFAGVPMATAQTAPDAPRVSGPFAHDNLTIFFVHGQDAPGPVPLTLQEAMEKGKVLVHETGSVSELTIENTGEEAILVHAGDIVKGGQQDRVLTTTMILEPKSGKTPLAAFCVEQGRWSARGKEDAKLFASAREMLPSREAKLAMKAKLISAPAAGVAVAAAARDALVPEDNAARDANVRVHQRRLPANTGPGASAQGEVWKSVAGIQAALSDKLGEKVNSKVSQSSLQLALENEKVAAARQEYIDKIKQAGEKDGDIVGYAFAVNGKINSADIYASNGLFRKLWPRLLKAAATEALSARTTAANTQAPDPVAVQTFLATAAAGKSSDHEPAKGHKLRVRESSMAADFETVSSTGTLVHRNVLAQ